MRRLFSSSVVGLSLTALLQPASHAAGCLPSHEYAARQALNPQKLVTFFCKSASPLDVIRAIGIQTRMPIGIELGKDRTALEKTRRSYDLKQMSAAAALVLAVRGTRYSIHQIDGVTVLTASDLTPRQRTLISHVFSDFKPGTNESMASLGFSLYMWLGSLIDSHATFMASLSGSTNDEHFTLVLPGPMPTEAIANLIVNQGSKGLWILRVNPSWKSGINGVAIEIQPYQHYSNAAVGRP